MIKSDIFQLKERNITVRNHITELLKSSKLSALDISKIVKIPEKTVFAHLEHIRRSIHKKGLLLKVIPAQCLNCGFVFKKRDKINKPTRCPVCRSEHIGEPLFKIETV